MLNDKQIQDRDILINERKSIKRRHKQELKEIDIKIESLKQQQKIDNKKSRSVKTQEYQQNYRKQNNESNNPV